MPCIQCHDLASLATMCAYLTHEGIVFTADTSRLTITIKGY